MNDPKLPDLFTLQNGQRVATIHDWQRRRHELLETILHIEYGPLPPAPAATNGIELKSDSDKCSGNARCIAHRLSVGGASEVQFALNLILPSGPGPFPVVLNGDACWPPISDEITLEILRRGCALATFDRTEIFPDSAAGIQTTALRRLYPDTQFAALATWAWGYHRCVDFLATLPHIDAKKIATVGHSRGGKCALLATATDERIAAAGINASGCGGAGCFRAQGPNSEKIANILGGFPYWFSPNFRNYIDKESSLPFDQHSLAALVAPRPLLFTEALGDLWSNPSGAWHTYAGTKQAYQFLHAAEKIGIVYRQGGHEHNKHDWTALLDFLDVHFHGNRVARRFDVNPF